MSERTSHGQSDSTALDFRTQQRSTAAANFCGNVAHASLCCVCVCVCVCARVLQKDLVESFTKGSGRGGQKLNKTSSCVHLLHLPTGTRVKCQFSRELQANRQRARVIMQRRLEELLLGTASRTAIKAARVRKQKDRNRRRRAKKHYKEGEEEQEEEGEDIEEDAAEETPTTTTTVAAASTSAPTAATTAAATPTAAAPRVKKVKAPAVQRSLPRT